MLKNIVALYCLIQLSTLTLAQKGAGKLTGKVTDASTNEPLAGVSITAKSTNHGGATITDGTYILTLPAGSYTIRYSYTGHKIKEITGVIIKSGESTFLDILLETATKELQGVVVTASIKKESQASVYSTQKRSAAASDGISQEAIRRTPDNNAAQVLTRVTGVNVQDNRFVVVRGLADRYNQTVVNGVPMTSTETNRSAFAFDLIPALVVDNIVVNKTATPDMPGNFAGGIVQVNTKDFPDRNFFSINLQAGFADGTLGKDFISDKRGKFEWLGFAGDFRDLPKGFPTSTSRVGLTYLNAQEKIRWMNSLPNRLVRINHGGSKPNEQIQLGLGKTIKFRNGTQFGIVAAINQRNTELIEQEEVLRQPTWNDTYDSLVGFGTSSANKRYSSFSNTGAALNLAYRFENNKVSLKSLFSSTFTNQYIERDIHFLQAYSIPSTARRYPLPGVTFFNEQKSIFNSILAGEHRTGKNDETRLEWNISYTANVTNTPDIRNFIFTYDTVYKVYSLNSDANIDQALSQASRSWTHSKDDIYGGSFNVTTPFILFKKKQLLKSGILFQIRTRKATGSILPLLGGAGTIDSVLVPGNTSVSIGQAAYGGNGGNYNGGTDLLAAYESLENKLGEKTRIIWGLRFEDYQQTVNVYTTNYSYDFREPDLVPLKYAVRTTFNFLPSVNIIYSPIPAINVRGAYSQTVIRPELKDLAAYASYDFTTFTETQGNQDLKSSSIANYDLKFEWFPTAGEIISFGAFYKDIHDPIEYATSTLQDRIDTKFAYNTGNAFVKGLEGEVRKKLDFLPFASWLSHVSLFGNASVIKSKVSGKHINSFVLGSFEEHSLSGQANYIVNAGISIALFKDNFETTLSFNRTGDYINELGTSDLAVHLKNGAKVPVNPHFRVKARNMGDLVSSMNFLNRKGQIKFKIGNLFKQPYILYQDLNGNGKLDAPAAINVGMHPSAGYEFSQLNNYRGGIDNIASKMFAQRTYSLSVSYTF